MIEIVFACFASVSGDAITPPQDAPAWEYYELETAEQMNTADAFLGEREDVLEYRCRAYRVEREPTA